MLSEGDQQGIEVYIARNDGSKFTEHRVEHNEGRSETPSSTTCFLESEEGSTFTIVVDMSVALKLNPASDWRIESFVDGRKIRTSVIRRDRTRDYKVSTMISTENGELVKGKLTFARLQTTDEETAVTLKEKHLRSLGRIVITFERGTRTGAVDGLPISAQPDLGVADERMKKLGGSVGSTSKKAYTDKRAYAQFVIYDVEKLFHRLTFNYRTRPVLEIMNIIEGPVHEEPVPPPPTGEDQGGAAADGDGQAVSVDGEIDQKPSRKALLAARMKEVERQVERLAKRSRTKMDVEIVDLTGED